MKKKLSILIILCLVFYIATTEALPKYTTDSEIAPKELDQWAVVLKSPTDVPGFYYLVAENPELWLDSLNCAIKFVLVCIDSRKKEMVAYAYYRNNDLMVFEIKDGHFGRIYRIVPEVKALIDWFLKPLLEKFKKPDDGSIDRIEEKNKWKKDAPNVEHRRIGFSREVCARIVSRIPSPVPVKRKKI